MRPTSPATASSNIAIDKDNDYMATIFSIQELITNDVDPKCRERTASSAAKIQNLVTEFRQMEKKEKESREGSPMETSLPLPPHHLLPYPLPFDLYSSPIDTPMNDFILAPPPTPSSPLFPPHFPLLHPFSESMMVQEQAVRNKEIARQISPLSKYKEMMDKERKARKPVSRRKFSLIHALPDSRNYTPFRRIHRTPTPYLQSVAESPSVSPEWPSPSFPH